MARPDPAPAADHCAPVLDYASRVSAGRRHDGHAALHMPFLDYCAAATALHTRGLVDYRRFAPVAGLLTATPAGLAAHAAAQRALEDLAAGVAAA